MQRRNAESGLRVVKASLGAVLGLEEDFDVAEPAGIATGDEATAPERLLERAIAGRDDLRMQRTALDVADRGSTDSWARFLPSLRLIANGRYTSNTSGLASEPFTGLIGVQASVPLFDGGLAWGSVKESQAKVTEEILKTRQLELQVEQEVRGALDDIVLKAEAHVTAERVATLARAQLENAERLFEAGAATELDVADARLASFQSDVDASRARFDVEVARLGLQYAIGELRPAGEHVPAPVESADEDRARAYADRVPD
jgi:outer membrane protein TolC